MSPIISVSVLNVPKPSLQIESGCYIHTVAFFIVLLGSQQEKVVFLLQQFYKLTPKILRLEA